MTETTKEIFEKYQVRKTKKQKSAFIDYVRDIASREGYDFKVEKGSFSSRNIVVGDVKRASLVYTAHYDTCPVLPMPNFITPKCVPLYVLYQLLLTAVIFVPVVLMCFATAVGFVALSAFVSLPDELVFFFITAAGYISFIFVFLLMLFGPANKHTANDNTSGVTTLLDIMAVLPQDLRGKVAFVFFDLEEVGLVGSSSFAKAHREEMKDKLLVNFDCVSDGDNFIFALRKGAREYKGLLEQAFVSDVYSVEVLSKSVFYPSDQISFPLGVGVAALKRSKLGILYMNRIHTPRDTIYKEENIAYLVLGSCRLAELLCKSVSVQNKI